MANPCIYTYKGKDYTYDEFASLLHGGELAVLSKSGKVTGDFLSSMPSQIGGRQSVTGLEIDELARNIPKSHEVKQYLSGETIKRNTGEDPENNQDYNVQELLPALEHGGKIVDSFKEKYGEDYVSAALDYLDSSKLRPENEVLVLISLENDLVRRKKTEPENAGQIQKLLNLVRTKSQPLSRSGSLVIGFNRLNKFAEYGFDVEVIKNKFFSPTELEGKKRLEKAIQSNPDAINKEADLRAESTLDADIEKAIQEGVEKQINEIYKKMPSQRRIKADKAVKALENIQKKLRGKAYDASIGIPVAIIDSGITVIKNAIKAGANIADAIELGINHIKEKYGKSWDKEDLFRKDMTEGFKSEGVSTEIDPTVKDLVKEALIGKGFGREVTTTKKTVNSDGSLTKEKTVRQVVDWKKLAGEEGSVEKIRRNVEEALKDKGYTDSQIKEMADDLENEYHDLRASIIEKAIKELDNRNAPRKPVDRKSSARRLAELYNYGLFEKNETEYENLINSAVGMNKLGQDAFADAKNLAKKLAEIYATKKDGGAINDLSGSVAISKINSEIEKLLAKVAWSQSNGAFKAAQIAKEFAGLSQRFLLVSLGQAIENPLSGYIERGIQKLGHAIQGGVDTKELRQRRRELARELTKDIVLRGGDVFGRVNTPLLSKTRIEDKLNDFSDSKLYHSAVSFLMGKAFLEGADSAHKIALTEKYFAYNLVKVLTDKSNPNRMNRQDAINFVSEQLTGQNFEDAKKTADEIIEKVNKGEDKPILPTNEQFRFRLANEVVKMSLLEGKKMTFDQIKAAYESAYTTAGFGLGHEANNVVSKSIAATTNRIENQVQKAIKDKDWNAATRYTMQSILFKNILSPFVGGGTNWTVLQLQKTGLDPIALAANTFKSSKQIDLTSDQGMKNLREILTEQLRTKNTNNRVIIGGLAAIATYAMLKGGDDEEDRKRVGTFDDWLKKNEWAKKYFYKVSPQVLLYLIAQENEKVGTYLYNLFGGKYANNSTKNFTQGVDELTKGNASKGTGKIGKALGSYVSAPVPYKLLMDVDNINRGVRGRELYRPDYATTDGFLNGLLQGGLFEYAGLRPKGEESESKTDAREVRKRIIEERRK